MIKKGESKLDLFLRAHNKFSSNQTTAARNVLWSICLSNEFCYSSKRVSNRTFEATILSRLLLELNLRANVVAAPEQSPNKSRGTVAASGH